MASWIDMDSNEGFVCVPLLHSPDDTLWWEAVRWLASPDQYGMYFYRRETYGRTVFYIRNPDVAFEFKMRFG